MSRLGFSTANADSQNFLPFIKYDARAGLFKRVDREFDGVNWYNNETIIPADQFCAMFDMENAETGPMDFNTGGAPSMLLIRMSDLERPGAFIPSPPAVTYKMGVRILIKLHRSIGGDKPIREICSNAKTFCRGFELLDDAYIAERNQHPSQLPIIKVSQVLMIKSGSGQKTSTNFQPVFQIIGWAPRGDLAWTPKTLPAPNQQQPAPQPQRPPQQQQPQLNYQPQQPMPQQGYPERPAQAYRAGQFQPAMTGGPNGNAGNYQPQQHTMHHQGNVPGQTPLQAPPWDSTAIGGAPSTGSQQVLPPERPQQNQPQPQQNQRPQQTFDANDFG